MQKPLAELSATPCLHHLAGISVPLLQRPPLIKQHLEPAVHAQCINKALTRSKLVHRGT